MSEVRLSGQERLDLADAVFLHDGEEWLETTYAAVEAIIAARLAAVEALADELDATAANGYTVTAKTFAMAWGIKLRAALAAQSSTGGGGL